MRSRTFLTPAALLVLGALATVPVSAAPHAPAPPRAPASPPAPTSVLHIAKPIVTADEDGVWRLEFAVRQAPPGTLYLDSLVVTTEDLDPGQTRVARTSRRDFSVLLRAAPALAPGDSIVLDANVPVTAEHARLTLTLHAHANGGRVVTLEERCETEPGAAWAALASEMLAVGGRKVESAFVPAEGATGDAPGVLLVHDHASHARLMLPLARRLAAQGFAVMVVSLPGYGTSDGPADLGGPASVGAATAALDALAHHPGVDAAHLGVWGFGRGAAVAATVAARRADVRALVAQSGLFDLWATYRAAAGATADAIVAEAGRDSAAWRARSPLLAAAGIPAAVLVIHGERDPEQPAATAHAFVAELTAAGHAPETKFLPNAGHALPGLAENTAVRFLARTLHGAGTPR